MSAVYDHEKGLRSWNSSSNDEIQPRRRKVSPIVIAFLIAAAILHLTYHPPFDHSRVVLEDRKIGKLIPTDCWYGTPEPFKCSYMHAPLDHLNSSDTRTAKLAVAFYPAGAGKTSKKEILGTVLLNPGGPGGSGVGFLTTKSSRYQGLRTAEAIDQLFKGRYNLLSWDVSAILS